MSSLINDSFMTDFERQLVRFKGIRLIDCSEALRLRRFLGTSDLGASRQIDCISVSQSDEIFLINLGRPLLPYHKIKADWPEVHSIWCYYWILGAQPVFHHCIVK